MDWIDTLLGLTRDQWVVIGLMGSALAWFVVLGVVQTDEAETAIGALISAPPQGLLVHAVLSHMDSRGPSLRRLFPCQQRSYSNTVRTSPGLMSVPFGGSTSARARPSCTARCKGARRR